MKRTIAMAALLVVVLADAGGAQESVRPRPEIGFRGGISVLREQGESLTVISFPESGFFFTGSTAYAMLFVGNTLAVEPQLGFIRVSSDGGSTSVLTAAAQVNGFFGDPEAGAPFAFVNAGVTRPENGEIYAIGAGAGYRAIVTQTLGLRLEGRYRRLFAEDSDTANEFSLLIGIAALLGNSTR
jgi:hypothetical protein